MIIDNPDTFRENIVGKLNKLIRKKKFSLNVEKGIYNWSIQEAKIKNVIRKWSNANFVLLFTQPCSVSSNLLDTSMMSQRHD